MVHDNSGKKKRWAGALAAIALVVAAVALGVNHFDQKIGPADMYLPPRGYVCYRATGPLAIDGKLDETAWAAVPWTEDFVDIEGALGAVPRYRTRVKMLWDDKYFYVGAELEEPHVQASYTQHDSYIFHEDNDFEVFINPDGSNHNYIELEMNALNTTWDLLLKKPYRDDGLADDDYEIEGLKTAVHIDGKLNDPGDLHTKGWSIELAFPWESLGKLSNQPAPPRNGDCWRVNFSRVQWHFDVVNAQYQRVKDRPEDNWVWSPQGKVNMHCPETWGYVQFSTAATCHDVFRPDLAGPAKHLLHRIYYAESAFHESHHGRYAATLADLELSGLNHATLTGPPTIDLQPNGYHATVEVRLADGNRQRYRIRQDSLLVRVP